MGIVTIIGLTVASAAAWVFFLFCTFKLRQTTGKDFVNDVYTDLGGGSFTDSVVNPVKKFFWGASAFATFFVALFLTIFLISKFDNSDSTKQEKALQQPNIQNPTIPPKVEGATTNPVIIQTPAEIKKEDDSANKQDDVNKASSGESVLSKCESETNFISANNCRWSVCAESENKAKEECRKYTKD